MLEKNKMYYIKYRWKNTIQQNRNADNFWKIYKQNSDYGVIKREFDNINETNRRLFDYKITINEQE